MESGGHFGFGLVHLFLSPETKNKPFHVEIGQMEYKKTVAKIKQKMTHLQPTPNVISHFSTHFTNITRVPGSSICLTWQIASNCPNGNQVFFVTQCFINYRLDLLSFFKDFSCLFWSNLSFSFHFYYFKIILCFLFCFFLFFLFFSFLFFCVCLCLCVGMCVLGGEDEANAAEGEAPAEAEQQQG